MKKILLLFLIGFSSNLFCQNLADTTQFYFEIKDTKINEAIHYCLTDIDEWNKEHNRTKGMIKVLLSYDNELTLRIKHFQPTHDDLKVLPENYSYINGWTVFLYTGKTLLEEENKFMKDFLMEKFSAYFRIEGNTIIYPPKKDELVSNQEQEKVNFIDKITVEEVEKQGLIVTEGNISSYSKSSTPIPEYIIRRTNYGNIFIDKIQKNIYVD